MLEARVRDISSQNTPKLQARLRSTLPLVTRMFSLGLLGCRVHCRLQRGLRVVLFTERRFFLLGEVGTIRPMANPMASSRWSFMIYSGSSRLSSIIQGRTKKRNPPPITPLPSLLFPTVSEFADNDGRLSL